MHAIALVAFVGMIVGLERAWCLFITMNADARRLMTFVQSRLIAGDSESAIRACERRGSAVARVLYAGLMAGVDRHRARAAVRVATHEVESRLTSRIPLLSQVAGIALMLGLLGTVFGMISGFVCVATVSADARAHYLAQDLEIALHTTAFGLMVAIPLLAWRVLMSSTSARLVEDVARCGSKIVNLVHVARTPLPRAGSPYRDELGLDDS